MATWSVGDHLTHRFNADLGTGRVVAIEGRVLVVHFAQAETTLRLASHSDALVPAVADAPAPARTLLQRLAMGAVDETEDVLTRLDVLHLRQTREADGLGSFLGGRVRLFPHQLHVAERATHRRPVRWLLADEVGLGKTIEAALIMNRLLHTERIDRCLVVAPDALTVQWLGELWRKYHQVFTLLDGPRLADVARDFGQGFNPFDAHSRAVIALEMLVERPHLTRQAAEAGIDLLVVDEAQRLRRAPGHPGSPAYRAVAPIAADGRHVLLLSATPLEDDAHGFFRLLQLLRPDEFPEPLDVDARLASGVALPPCTSSTRRVDIGGLPPRQPRAIDVPASDAAASVLTRIDADVIGRDPLTRRRTLDRLQRALSSAAALAAVDPDVPATLAEALDRDDPRLAWLLAHARQWHDAGEKTLIFVAHRESLDMLRQAFTARVQLASGVFHEDLSPVRRDTEVARFRADDGPSLLVSTEAGGEGRNFEFCHRLVLYDLPWTPSAVEQRIGRLDRIGRRIPVHIVYFRPASGIGATVARLYERFGLFDEPIAGIEPQLTTVEDAIRALALQPDPALADDRLDAIVADAQAARTRVHDAAYQQLHREPYRAELGPALLARVPTDLDALMERVVTNAASRLGFRVEQVRGRRAWAIEFGNQAVIDSLPGVPGGASFIGSFDREYAVQDETRDFFASGHALVEGLLAHFEDDARGRVGRLELEVPPGVPSGPGVVAVFKDGPTVTVTAFDADGQEQPAWATALAASPPPARRMSAEDMRAHDWPAIVARLTPRVGERHPHLVAAVSVRSRPRSQP